MRTAGLIFPHQLFKPHPVIRQDVEKVCLVEESLFFGDDLYPLNLHRQKLAYHVATLDAYQKLTGEKLPVERINYTGRASLLDSLTSKLAKEGVECVLVADVHDFELQKRLERACSKAQSQLEILPTPAFLNSPDENRGRGNGRPNQQLIVKNSQLIVNHPLTAPWVKPPTI